MRVPHPEWLRQPRRIALLMTLTVVGLYLGTVHSAHVVGLLPYALILLCPLLHLFMMRGHHGQHGSEASHDHHDRDGTA